MEYNRIIAITGLGGLFELLSSKSDGAIVRSLEDQQTRFVSSRVHNFSHLESIEVYTTRENINLVDLFQAIQASGQPLPSDKDAAAVKGFFVKVYPDLDFERIYNSDMKKMVKWYALLTANQVEFKLSAEGEPAEEAVVEETHEEAPKAAKTKAKAPVEEAPAPKKAAKASHEEAPKPAKAAAHAEKEEAPKSPAKGGAARTAKAAPAEEAPKAKAAKPAASKADDKKADTKKADDKKKAAPKKK